jgi:uncharacterized membrane protein HdeD (DUF308 family)
MQPHHLSSQLLNDVLIFLGMFALTITPVRLLFLAVILAGAIQFLKQVVPFLNGWAALLLNAMLTAVGLYVLFRFSLTWTALAAYFLVGLAAAGIHGTLTKISDHPHPRSNPTPSGTVAQNYDKMDA